MRVLSLFLLYVAIVTASAFTPFDSPEFCLQIITPSCNTTFSYIDELNSQVRPFLVKLVRTPFFKYFKLNFDKQCKFWNAQHFCATENCAVEILPSYNWLELANDLKPSKLGEINRPNSTDGAEDVAAQTCEDLDYCHIDDDHQCVYVDLLENPERFTGYGGSQSLDVWKAIYSENCFPNTNPMLMTSEEPEQCTEKNLFYRLISGMHASIAVHLSNEFLDPATGEFFPSLEVFMERVGKFNDRIANIYFNYALVTQSIVKLNELISLADTVKAGDEDSNTHQHTLLANEDSPYDELLSNILPPLESNTLFETTNLFDPLTVAPGLKDEFRSRFKNVSAIMDCVGCDRCRMWGKLQTIGYGTALKILFEGDDNSHLIKFRRIELVALFNTFDRLSKSIEAINNFKTMYLRHLEDVAAGLAQPGVYDNLSNQAGLGFPFFETPKKAPKRIPQKKPEKAEQEQDRQKADRLDKKRTPQLHSVIDEFRKGLEEVGEVLKFIWTSYVTFPAFVFKYVLVYLNGWWNVFIGKSVYTGEAFNKGY